jgi:hypothetical protein
VTLTTNFTIQPPQQTWEAPSFTIEKQQEIEGSGTGFTTSTLTGALGQTVNYQIVVTNTGNVPLKFSELSDAHCDVGTIGGGPGSASLAPGASTTYTCDHVLTTVGAYTNEATATGTSPGGVPIEHTSNQVVVEVPTTVGPEPRFTIEKLQQINGSGFTTTPLTGLVGETVDYEIVVTNTGNVALTFPSFSDPNCEVGTLAGGPGKAAVAPGAKTIYTCSRVLASVGSFFNVATVTGIPEGEAPITHHSNEVEVKSAENSKTPAPEPKQVTPTAATPPPSPKIGKLAICERSMPLKGASGPKRHVFTVQTSSSGIKQITFYLDGRKIKTLKQSQAKHGEFTIEINPTRLSYGAHRLSTKTIESNPKCKAPARSSVFVRPLSERAPPKFTG